MSLPIQATPGPYQPAPMEREDVEFSALVTLRDITKAGEAKAAFKLLRGQGVNWEYGTRIQPPDAIFFRKAFPDAGDVPDGTAVTALALYRHLIRTINPDDLDPGSPPVELGTIDIHCHRQDIRIETEEGQLETAVALIAALQERYATNPVEFNYWAQYGDHAYDGGAVFVDDGKAEYLRASQWCAERRRAFNQKNQARPTAGPEFTP